MILQATRTGIAPFGEWQTWYRVTGDLSSPMTPLVVVHGGPGCTHDYVLALAELARSGRPVIHYDQIGAGRSTHLPERGGDFWTVDLFLRELDNLLEHLGVKDRYHLLGTVLGRDAGRRARAAPPGGTSLARHLQLAGVHGALGEGSEPAALQAARRRTRRPRPTRSRRHHRRPGVRGRDPQCFTITTSAGSCRTRLRSSRPTHYAIRTRRCTTR